ncbi:diadenylate cyclase [Planctomycetota bacterium]|nr:diadenylate cyclase [Planctomycetota bacterium]
MPPDPKTVAQVLILTVGIQLFLSFLTTARSSRMIRGAALAYFVLYGVLLTVAQQADLVELEVIVNSVTGFAVVILAVVFQPELRRGILRIGDTPLLRRFLGRQSYDAVDEVAEACISMAKRKQGALIAFERQATLDSYTTNAVKVDGNVHRDLLDSIFHTGGALHDGAVILREGRVLCAMAILPLSENDQLARSVGTRHRAALGLTEETDAVVVAVSEETGLISVFQGGTMERRVLRDELGDVLRARLGGDDLAAPSRAERRPLLGRLSKLAFGDPGGKLTSLLLAVFIFTLAGRAVMGEQTFTVEVRVEAGSEANTIPTRGVLTVVLPSAGLHLANPLDGDDLEVRVEASEAQLDMIRGGLGGVLIVDESWVGKERQVEPSDLSWGLGRVQGELEVRFLSPEALVLRVEQYANDQVEPSIASLAASPEAAAAGDFALISLPQASGVLAESLEFNPSRVGIRGPARVIEAISADPSLLAFEPIDLSAYTGRGFVERVRIDRAKWPEIELDGELFLRGELAPKETLITTLELEVALVSFDAARLEGDIPFLPPTELVKVQVMERGLFPDGLPEATRTQMLQEILQFARENARVFVDVDRALREPGSRAPVEIDALDPLWRERLGPYFNEAKADPASSLRLIVDDSTSSIALVRELPDDDQEK